jgi:hypothetical protein
MRTEPSTPFSNGTELEFFLENFCERCEKCTTDAWNPAPSDCKICNALHDARWDITKWPKDYIVKVYEDGERFPTFWHICKEFNSEDIDLMNRYHALFGT